MKKIVLNLILVLMIGSILKANIVDTSNFKKLDEQIIDYNIFPKNSSNTDEYGNSVLKIEFYLDKKTKDIWAVSYYSDNRIVMRKL